MKKIYLKSLLLPMLNVFCFAATAQQGLFKPVEASRSKSITGARTIMPKKYKTCSLDNAGMNDLLSTINSKDAITGPRNSTIIDLPSPDGSIATFNIQESSIMEPALQARFPEIRTYSGQGIDDPTASIKITYDPYFGFNAQVLSAKGSFYIDPFARGNKDIYNSYFGRDLARATGFVCENPAEQLASKTQQTNAAVTAKCRGAYLYKYRLAVACTGEYAIAATGNPNPAQAEVLSRIVTSVNRVNGIYESELAIRLILVANETNVIYTDPTTDPFTGNNNGGTLIGESQNVMTLNIGSTNYDIGHTFSTGAGGTATLGCVCGMMKARGITGSPNPVGDAYDVDYVAHEMGHQFGALHTFNSSAQFCGGNWSPSSAYEPGSGTSIMAYAGICSTDNIQPNSDPYFHTMSFDQITLYLESSGTCKVSVATGNTLPVITSMGTTGKYIPRGTPFTLTGTATDANGDALTYSWEEVDLGASTVWNGGATTITSPLFRSRTPKASGSRTFPDMAVILAGYPNNPPEYMGGLKGETLPQVARAMRFRLTVRDNRVNGGAMVTGGAGCGMTTAFVVNVANTTGPFAVTAPNGGEEFNGGTTQTVRWNVVGTSASPISCASVKISLSTDGGWTYPTLLLTSTPNDGVADVLLPAINTTTARIKVEAIGNIFFDISDNNFSIIPPANCGTVSATTINIAAYSATLNWTAIPYANGYDLDYKLASDANWTSLADDITTTTFNLASLTELTSYGWRVRSNCPFGKSDYVVSQFSTIMACPGPYDVSTNGTITGAAQIPLNTNVAGKIDVKTDIDFYKFIITTGGTVNIRLSNQPANFSLALMNNLGIQIAVSANSGTVDENMNVTLAPGTYYVKVYSAGNTASTTACYILKVTPGTSARANVESLTSMSDPAIVIFPNPVINIVSIIASDLSGNPDMLIYDMTGKLVVKRSAGMKNRSIDVSNLAAGMYMMKLVLNGSEVGSSKFVKN